MADTKTYTVKNTAAGPRSFNAVGGYVHLAPGEEAEVELTEGEYASADGTGYFEFQGAAAAAEPTKEPRAPFLAKDKGGGWWVILDADGEEVGKSMRADAAEAFNALSDEAKSDHVSKLAG